MEVLIYLIRFKNRSSFQFTRGSKSYLALFYHLISLPIKEEFQISNIESSKIKRALLPFLPSRKTVLSSFSATDFEERYKRKCLNFFLRNFCYNSCKLIIAIFNPLVYIYTDLLNK